MSHGPEDPSLIALGAAISDGALVDWEEAERAAVEPEQRRLLENLRDVAKLVTAHRSEGAVSNNDVAVKDAQSIRHWRHLVLFEAVGAGAFGTVYRGWDSQLDREVAVKLLPKSGGGTASSLTEGRNLARIRHSNVVIVHGTDQDNEHVAIWMEYIEGQTLAEMTRDRGPMSPREVAGIGIDLCRALSALHNAGLLHRDIKAHNVMREIGGRIVLMDFSGAHAFAPERTSDLFSGTPLFMAPELFAGGPATPVIDVYSLGVLLFFLLTGGVPVDGATVADLRSAHARRARKRLRDVRPDLPDAIVQVIERATAHDASARYQTAGELEHALAAASGSHAVLLPPARGDRAALSVNRGFSQRAAAGFAAIVLLGTIAVAGFAFRKDATAVPLAARFTIGPPYTTGSWPRVSPDGRQVVFGTIVEGRNRFWIRALDALEGRALMNTTATETPFWSPDGQALAFFSDDKLKKISVDGGAPEILADAPHARGGDWNGSWIIFATENGIQKVTPDGASLSPLTVVDKSLGDYQHTWPEFLPGGNRFLYIIRSSSAERTGVYVGSLDGSASVRVMPAYSRVAYGDGHLLFVREGTLLAQPFDTNRATLRGQPVALAGRVKYHAEGDAAFDVSSSRVLIYSVDSGHLSSRLTLFDRRGREVQTVTSVGAHRQPRFSPDGQRIAAEKISPPQKNADVWIYNVARQSASRLTSIDAPDVKPIWSSDGKRIVFSSKRGDTFHIFSKMVDGTEPEKALVTTAGDKFVEHWSHDGRYLTATILRSGLWVIPLDRRHQPWRVRADTRAATWHSEFSPDGRWLAYMSEESGGPEVYVEPFPSTGARWQVSTRGGAEPHWRGDGKELFHLSAAGSLMSTDMSASGWQNAGPTPLFRVSVPDLAGNLDYSAAPDGQTFVINVFVADPLVPPIDVVVNWTSLLAR